MPTVPEIATLLGLEIAGKEAEVLLEEIESAITSLKDEIEKLEALVPALPKSGDSNEGGGPSPDLNDTPLAASHRSLLRQNRELQLSAMVDKGFLTPAAKVEALKAFGSEASLILACSTVSAANTPSDFDLFLDTLKANGPVIAMGEMTGAQGLLDPNDLDPKTNPVLADADSRIADADSRIAQ